MNRINLNSQSYTNYIQQKGSSPSSITPNINFKSDFTIPQSCLENIGDVVDFTIPTGNIEVTVATKNDAEDLASFIYQHINIAEQNEPGFKKMTRIAKIKKDIGENIEKGSIVHIARDAKNQVIACAELTPPNPKNGIGTIYDFHVAESMKGKGIEEMLVEHIIKDALDSGDYTLLTAYERRSDAEKYFNDFGFEEIPNEQLERAKREKPFMEQDLVQIILKLHPVMFNFEEQKNSAGKSNAWVN